MKKSIKFCLFLVVAVMVLGLFACGGAGGAYGKWRLDVWGTPGDPSDDAIYDLKSGGTCTLSLESLGVSYDVACTITGNTISITEPTSGETLSSTYVVSGSTLTLTDPDGSTYSMTRVP